MKWITEIFKTKTQHTQRPVEETGTFGNLRGRNIVCPSPGAFLASFLADDYNSSNYLEEKRSGQHSVQNKALESTCFAGQGPNGVHVHGGRVTLGLE